MIGSECLEELPESRAPAIKFLALELMYAVVGREGWERKMLSLPPLDIMSRALTS